MLWRTLGKQDWKPDDCGVVGVGFLDRELEKELVEEASDVIKRFNDRRLDYKDYKGWNDIGDFLVVCLRYLPAVPSVIVSLAAHIQRLTLELFGLVEWLGEVFGRVKAKRDCRLLVLDVVGAHTSDPSVAQMLHQAGIPVWYQQAFSTHLVVYDAVSAQDAPLTFRTHRHTPILCLRSAICRER